MFTVKPRHFGTNITISLQSHSCPTESAVSIRKGFLGVFNGYLGVSIPLLLFALKDLEQDIF